MWVLIVAYAAYNLGSFGFTQEFSSKDKCELAKVEIIKWGKNISAICVEK